MSLFDLKSANNPFLVYVVVQTAFLMLEICFALKWLSQLLFAMTECYCNSASFFYHCMIASILVFPLQSNQLCSLDIPEEMQTIQQSSSNFKCQLNKKNMQIYFTVVLDNIFFSFIQGKTNKRKWLIHVLIIEFFMYTYVVQDNYLLSCYAMQ